MSDPQRPRQPAVDEFCRAQFARFGLDEFFATWKERKIQYYDKQFRECFTALFATFGCSLREQEHCFALLSLAIRTTKADVELHPLLLSCLIVLKVKNHKLYLDFVASKANYQDVVNLIASTSIGKEFLDDGYGMQLEIELALCRRGSPGTNELRRHLTELAQNASDLSQKKRAEELAFFLSQFNRNFWSVCGKLDEFVQKIDLVSRFVQ